MRPPGRRSSGPLGVDRRRPLVIGVSGPDGAGKTTIAGALASRLLREGRSVARVHPYGCVVCRRLPDSLVSDPAEANGSRSHRLIALQRSLHVVHGLVDAAELALRLRLSPRTAAGRGPLVVVADRSALDGLVKFRPRRGALLERVFRRLALGFDAIVLLEASPSTLASRDGEHSDRILGLLADRFRSAAEGLAPVVRVDAEGEVDDVVNAAAGALGRVVRPLRAPFLAGWASIGPRAAERPVGAPPDADPGEIQETPVLREACNERRRPLAAPPTPPPVA